MVTGQLPGMLFARFSFQKACNCNAWSSSEFGCTSKPFLLLFTLNFYMPFRLFDPCDLVYVLIVALLALCCLVTLTHLVSPCSMTLVRWTLTHLVPIRHFSCLQHGSGRFPTGPNSKFGFKFKKMKKSHKILKNTSRCVESNGVKNF
jgi:hypothetical protein